MRAPTFASPAQLSVLAEAAKYPAGLLWRYSTQVGSLGTSNAAELRHESEDHLLLLKGFETAYSDVACR